MYSRSVSTKTEPEYDLSTAHVLKMSPAMNFKRVRAGNILIKVLYW